MGQLGQFLRKGSAIAVGVAFVAAVAAMLFLYRPSLLAQTTHGRVFIDSPEVYTRERLVNDRFIQDAWLRSKLEELGAEAFSSDDRVQRSAELQFWLGADAPTGGEGAAGSDTPQAADARGFFEVTQTYRLHNTLREQIRQDIIENQLDDRHDLAGNKLYMLKFDASVIPGENTVDSAIVEIDAEAILGPGSEPQTASSWESEIGPLKAGPWREFYIQWLNDLESRLNERISRTFEAISSGQGSNALIQEFFDFYDLYLKTAPSDEAVSIEIRKISQELRRTKSWNRGASVGRTAFDELVSDPGKWQQLRFSVNLFSVREAIQAVLGAGVEPQYWFQKTELEGFEDKVDMTSSRPTFLNLSNMTEALLLELDVGSPLFVAEYLQSASIRSPPRLKLSERSASFAAFEQDCHTELNPLMSEQWFFERNSFAGFLRQGETTTWVWFGFDPHWDLKGERHYANWDVPSTLRREQYLAAAVGEPAGRANVPLGLLLGDPQKSFENQFPACRTPPGGAATAWPGVLPVGFIAFASELTRESPYSYAVLPRYDAALEELHDERELGIAARLPGSGEVATPGGGGSASRTMLSGLRARTSLVGYGTEVPADCGATGATGDANCKARTPRFGWVIAAKQRDFGIEAPARMSATQRSLAALISVPSWWEQLRLSVRVGWMDREGTVQWVNHRGEFFDEAASDAEMRQAAAGNANDAAERDPFDQMTGDAAFRYTVMLPRDLEAVDDIVFDRRRRGPQISSLEIEDGDIVIPPCAGISLEIPGQRLWRSAVVTLAGKTAQKIEVLPNMRGIIATFGAFDSPVSDVRGAKLTVWTSEGSAQYPRDIVIKAPADGASCGQGAAR